MLKLAAQEAIVESENSMDELATARAGMEKAVRALQQSDYVSAIELLRTSLQTFVMRGDAANAAAAYSHLGNAYRATGNTIEAYSSFEKSGTHAVALLRQSSELLIVSLFNRGVMCAQGGKLLEAYLLCMHALSSLDNSTSPRAQEIKRIIEWVRTQAGPQQAGVFDNSWQQYQQFLSRAQQSGQTSISINVSS